MPEISDRLYKLVGANTAETKTYLPANGETLNVSEAYGQAGSSPDTVVSVIWDDNGGAEQVLFCTHSSGNDGLVNEDITGDGVKLLTIKLVNDQNTSDYLGAGWRGFKD